MRRRGTVLIVVLVLVALAGATLARLLEENALELTLAAREADRGRLRAEAWGEMELALAALAEIRNVDRGRLHAAEQGWADPRAYLGLPPRAGLRVTYVWEVENGKLPLPDLAEADLTLLFQSLGRPTTEAEELADALMGWTRPGHEPEDDRAADDAYDQAAIPYRAPRRSLRSFEELRAIGVIREAFFDPAGRPTRLMEDFQRVVSLHRFPATSANYAEPEALQVLGFSAEGIAKARAYRAEASDRPRDAAPYFRSREEALSVLGGGNGQRVTSLIQLLRLTVVVQDGRSACSVGVLLAIDPSSRFPEAAADPTEVEAGKPEPEGTAKPGSTGKASLSYPFPILEWTETGTAQALSQGPSPRRITVTTGEPIPAVPNLETPLLDLERPTQPPARTGNR